MDLVLCTFKILVSYTVYYRFDTLLLFHQNSKIVFNLRSFVVAAPIIAVLKTKEDICKTKITFRLEMTRTPRRVCWNDADKSWKFERLDFLTNEEAIVEPLLKSLAGLKVRKIACFFKTKVTYRYFLKCPQDCFIVLLNAAVAYGEYVTSSIWSRSHYWCDAGTSCANIIRCCWSC